MPGELNKGEYRLLLQGACGLIQESQITQTCRWGSVRLVSPREVYGISPALKMSLPIYSLCESYGIYNHALGPKQSPRPLKRRSKKETRDTASDDANEVYLGGTRVDRNMVQQYVQYLFNTERNPLVLVLAKIIECDRIDVSRIDRPCSLTLSEAIQLWPNLMTTERRSIRIRFVD